MKRHLMSAVICFALVFTVQSCKKEQKTTKKSPNQTKSAVTKQPGWMLRDSATANLTSFDPVKIVDAFSVNVLYNVYEGLVNVSPDGRAVPGIASSWEHSADGKTWTFHLRRGVKFHPVRGCKFTLPQEVTAKDVVYSIQRSLTAPGSVVKWVLSGLIQGAADFAAGKARTISGIEVKGPYTLSLKLTRPYYLITRMATNAVWIYPAGIVKACGKDYLAAHEVGTGPYTVKNFVPDDKVVLSRFRGYRKKGNNPPSRVVIRIFSNPLAAIEAFERGDLDIVQAGVSTMKKARELAQNGNRLFSVQGNYLDYLIMNNKQPPFDDIRVRQAFNMAVNRQTLAKVLKGFGVPAHGFIPPFSKAYRGQALPEHGLHFDPARAKDLIAKYLGDKKLTSLNVELVIDSGETPRIIGDFVKSEIEKHLPGVHVKLKKVTWPAMLQMAFGGKGVFYRFWWNIVSPGNDLYFLFYFPGNDPPAGFNLSFYESQDFTRKFNDVMSTLDEKKRIQGIHALEDMLIQDAVAMPLLHKTFYFLERKGVKCPINGMLKKPYFYATKTQ